MAVKRHQWIQHVQKPLAGLLRHLNRPNGEEVRPPPFFSFKLCWNWFYNSHSCAHEPGTRSKTRVINLAPNGSENGPNCRTVRAPPAPNRLALRHMVAYDRGLKGKGPNGYTTVPTSETVQLWNC
jgi:hypothetical protein